MPSPIAAARLAPLRAYIKDGWTTLTRSLPDLPRAADDPKLKLPLGAPRPVYVSAKESLPRVEAELAEHLNEAQRAGLQLRTLPEDTAAIENHGLLYLPHPYVVPGGRFNEMYGWDSYFIAVGLLHDEETNKARDIVDNFLYEIEHYGTLLNANRTYYLTRSHPPFLARMVRDVYARSGDREWLATAMRGIAAHHRFWTSGPHLDPVTRLSRYWDFDDRPGAEVLGDENDAQGHSHYDRMRDLLRTGNIDDYDVSAFYDRDRNELTPLFYRGDRSMRESGFDPSRRFGPGSVDIVHYAPVCLNSLLHMMETDAAAIEHALGNDDAAKGWLALAAARGQAIEDRLWDEDAGLYFDYNVVTGERRLYEFATTFYPLWVGAASAAQAARVAGNLWRFEAPGGLLTSPYRTGNQWDSPFGWAPLQMIAVAGLRRYGYNEAADRLARAFVTLVLDEFERTGTIVEKYDVIRRTADTENEIRFGYSENVIGFGWTNAAVLDLLAGLTQ